MICCSKMMVAWASDGEQATCPCRACSMGRSNVVLEPCLSVLLVPTGCSDGSTQAPCPVAMPLKTSARPSTHTSRAAAGTGVLSVPYSGLAKSTRRWGPGMQVGPPAFCMSCTSGATCMLHAGAACWAQTVAATDSACHFCILVGCQEETFSPQNCRRWPVR